MRLACPGAADQHDIALLSEEAAGGEVADEAVIDWGAVKLEVGDVLGKRNDRFFRASRGRALSHQASKGPFLVF
jgi:hypothetical protein